ncbi:expressed unknown protein [Seminavis robusta]|uniref:Uncharacterized protein n=1 Tax=Seminavis robusta TaxID=568900 RepID=A0A9N8EVB5_9STRA|nr:expressed unknown protein [Seminavis robusta]|eukprot:Sro1932_g306141.1  (492) ;mRNA; r:2365-3840
MVRCNFNLKAFFTRSVALVLLFANVTPVIGVGSAKDCTLKLQDGSTYVGNDINNVNGVTFSTAGTLTCEAASLFSPGPCQRATITDCLSVVCESYACLKADISTDVDAVQCKDTTACGETTLPALCTLTYSDSSTSIGAAIDAGIEGSASRSGIQYDASTNSVTCQTACDGYMLTISGCSSVISTSVCTLWAPDGTAYFGSALANLDDVEFDADTNTLTCKQTPNGQHGPCQFDSLYQSPTISGCSQLICEHVACRRAAITGVPFIDCHGAGACHSAKMTELPNDALVNCRNNTACEHTEITAADSSSGTRVFCEGFLACGVFEYANGDTIFNVDCLECRSSDACKTNDSWNSDSCLFNGETCLDGPQGSCPCSLTTCTGETYLEEDINALTDVSYDSNANSILCEGQMNGLCRGGTIMACPTVECSTQACKGTTVWKPNDLDCVGRWACKEAVLVELPSGATATCNGDRACVDAVFMHLRRRLRCHCGLH